MDEKGREVILEVKDLRKSYGEEEVLRGISFAIRRGEILSLVGPNGAGKTTIIRAILGLTYRYSGKINIMAKKVNYLAENEVPYPTMNVYEYMRFYGDLMGVDNKKIIEMLKFVNLVSHITKKCKNLSKGMKQRLLIARTFLNDPDLVILDEPFSGIDPAMRSKLLNFIREYVADTGASVFLTTHILSDVEKISHRVAIIRDGKIKYMGEVGMLGKTMRGLREMRIRIISKDKAITAINKLKNIPGVVEVVHETENVILCEYSSDVSEYDILSSLFEEKIKFRIISGDVEAAIKGGEM